MNRYIEQFASYLKDRSSESTVSSYQRDMELFYSRCGLSETGFMKLGTEQLQEYLAALSDEGKADSTILRTASALRSFYGCMMERGFITENPAEALVLPKKEKKQPVVLTPAEIELLMSLPKDDAKGLRDKAMLELLYATGIKVSELISIELEDIDLLGGSLTCRSGSHSRTVPIGHAAEKALFEYLSTARESMVENGEVKALFVSCRGRAMTRQGFWKLIKAYIDEAGIEKDVTPQTLRHSFAVHLLENGAGLGDVSEMLGFNDKSSSQIYRSMLSDRLKKTYKKAHPRA